MKNSYETPLLTRVTIVFSVITLLFSTLVVKDMQEIKQTITEKPTVNICVYQQPNETYEDIQRYPIEYLNVINREAQPPHVVSEQENLDIYISRVCESYKIDEQIVRNLIWTESRWNPDAIDLTGEFVGLMQISKKWQSGRAKRLGVIDLMDPYSNILVGVDFLAYILNETGYDYAWALMIYNEGYKNAYEKHCNGVVSEYANKIINI